MLRKLGTTPALEETSQPLRGLEAWMAAPIISASPSVLFTQDDLDSADPDEPLGQMVMAEPLQAALDQAISEDSRIDRIAPDFFEAQIAEPGFVSVAEKRGARSRHAPWSALTA